MDAALLVSRLLLAAVFAAAGAAKLADRAGSRRAMRGFGLPERFAGAVGLALPFIELAVALALIPSASARWGAVAAGGLLLIFALAIVRAMIRGEQPDCHCFGQIHSAPAGPAALSRNVLLVGMAGFVVIAGWQNAGSSPTAWIGSLDTAQAVGLVVGVLIVAAIVLLASFSFQLLRQNGRLLERIEALEQAVEGKPRVSARGLTVGSQAPAFSLPGLDHDLIALDDLLDDGRPVMLVFSDPRCGPCQALLPAIGRWQAGHADQFTLALLSRGSAEENRSKCEEHGVGRVMLQSDWEVSGAYQAYGSPAAVLIGEDGRIASELAQGAEQITALVERYAQGGVTVMEVPSTNGGSSAPELPIGEGDEN